MTFLPTKLPITYREARHLCFKELSIRISHLVNCFDHIENTLFEQFRLRFDNCFPAAPAQVYHYCLSHIGLDRLRSFCKISSYNETAFLHYEWLLGSLLVLLKEWRIVELANESRPVGSSLKPLWLRFLFKVENLL